MKWDELIKNIAAEVVVFVDELRMSGVDKETTWATVRQLAARLQFLMIHDAARRTKPPRRPNNST